MCGTIGTAVRSYTQRNLMLPVGPNRLEIPIYPFPMAVREDMPRLCPVEKMLGLHPDGKNVI